MGGRTGGDAATSRARRRTTSARSKSGSPGTCGGAGDDPSAVFVALADDEVARLREALAAPEPTDRAFHDLTGVSAPAAGRGIAAALKRTQIAWAKERGYASLQTSNEVRNEPIRRLNERHGYVLEPGVVFVRRTIAGP